MLNEDLTSYELELLRSLITINKPFSLYSVADELNKNSQYKYMEQIRIHFYGLLKNGFFSAVVDPDYAIEPMNVDRELKYNLSLRAVKYLEKLK